MFTERSGTIQSPSSEGRYKNNENCIWTIQAPIGHVIHLTWLSFNLENNRNCPHDYVKIYESFMSSNQEIIGTYVRNVYFREHKRILNKNLINHTRYSCPSIYQILWHETSTDHNITSERYDVNLSFRLVDHQRGIHRIVHVRRREQSLRRSFR